MSNTPGLLAVVKEGDWIELDCLAGKLHRDVSDAELTTCLADWAELQTVATADASEHRKNHVLQADQGCDFDFLVGCRGADVPRHSH